MFAYPAFLLSDGSASWQEPIRVVALLGLYDREKQGGETPADFYRRVDPKVVVAALGDLVASAPEAPELQDVGVDHGFEVAIGVGECAA